jgi:hypothetical protein
MTAAAFQATYADWRVIKGRKVVQVCFEIPLEAADTAYQVLGGMPIAAKEVWCAVARIVPEAANRKEAMPHLPEPISGQHNATPRPSVVPASAAGADNLDIPPELDRRRKSPAQIAGYLCTTPLFQRFLREKYLDVWSMCITDGAPPDKVAASAVRILCDVDSRADIKPNNADWSALQLAFRLWENHPELEDA